MAQKPAADTVQITFRIPKPWLKRADWIGEKMGPDGIVSRTDVLRRALADGIENLEKEFGK